MQKLSKYRIKKQQHTFMYPNLYFEVFYRHSKL